MTEQPPVETDRTEPIDLSAEMQRSYIEYAMSVIVSRALPDVRDGLKPVHRRVLYAMYDGGYRPDRGFNKCSRVVGDVMGQYHPHGDSAIYDALVRLVQDWSLRYPLVQGQGNFGSPGDDPAAAPRYTECRMAPLSMEMVRDIDQETVDFKPNYDGKTLEPEVLPSRFPNLLVNGSAGIAVGMATMIPPHNLREVAKAAEWVLRHPDATREEAFEAVMPRDPRPGLPHRRADHGPPRHRGRLPHRPRLIIMRAVVEVEEIQGRQCLVVTELPYQVNPDSLAQKIAEHVKDGRLAGIADIRDETSGRTGQRLVIVLKRDAIAKVVLNNLYKHTQLQTTFGANMLALVDGVPRTLPHRLVHPVLGRAPDRRHPAPHGVPAAQGRGGDPHPPRLPQGARPARRGHRPDPPLPDRRGGPQRPHRAARDRRDPGPRDPRPPAAPARGPGAAEDHRRPRQAPVADRGLQGHPRPARAAAGHHLQRALRHRRQVRRRPPHHDHAHRRRHVDGGPHPRGGRGRHDHPRGLRQAHPGRRVPLAAARRQGRAGCGAAR